MDPNEAMHQITNILRGYESDPWRMTMEDAVKLFEHVEALDGWLSKGGFLPERWSVGRGGK